MKDESSDILLEKRRALKYLAGLTGLVFGAGLSKKWVTPSLQAAIEPMDFALSGTIVQDLDDKGPIPP